MKTTLTLLLITVTTFSGVPGEIEVKKQTPAVVIAQPAPKQNKTDSLEAVYYKAIATRDRGEEKLIEKQKRSELIIEALQAKIKRLDKEVACHCRDTVYIHDTLFKKRKFLQLFKN